MKKSRIEIIDALRGFSLAGIVVVHIVEQYIGGPAPEQLSETARQGLPDYIVDGFIQFFLRGKFFALFSILFGMSFFIQFENAEKKGEPYRLRYLWRILLLMLIGYAHHLFYRGDILTIYALLAPFLILMIPVSNRGLWIMVGIVFLGIPRAIIFLIFGDQSVFGGPMFLPDSPDVLSNWEVFKSGSIIEVWQANAIAGFKQKMEFQLGVFYRFYLTWAFFIVGMWLGRIKYFKRLDEYWPTTKRIFKWSFLGFFVFGALTAITFSQVGQEFSFSNPWAIIGLHMADMINVCLTVIIFCGFVMVYQGDRGRKVLNVFKEYGRTALTNYVLQSLIGTFILFGWGLGYIGEWRNSVLFCLALAIIIIQISMSKAWLRRVRYEPLEWIWRSATYGRWM